LNLINSLKLKFVPETQMHDLDVNAKEREMVVMKRQHQRS